MTRILSLFVMFMLSGVMAFAQGRVVTGTVLDEKGQPVEGASITVIGTRVGTATDQNGNFRFPNVASDATLRVSGSGFSQQDLAASTSVVNFTVTRTGGVELTTVVVTALGIKKQPRELGYAQTTITNKTITQGKSVNAQQALNGKVSGVSVTTTNSSVFENAKINIRGIRSLTGNNQPMLVVDGAPTPLGFLSSIAPEDIQSETILKSAASAAIYGPDAVNGVIIITTKKGTGEKLAVTVTSAVQFTKVAFFPKLQHKFGAGAGELINPDGSYGYVPYENQLYGPAFDGSIQPIGDPLEDETVQSGVYSNKYADEKRKFYNTGMTLQNTISVSGKDFYASVDDAVVHGVVPDDRNRRTSFRFNSGKQAGRFSVNYGLNYVLQNADILNEGGFPGTSSSAYVGGLFFQVLQTADNIPITSYKDWKNNKYANPSGYYNRYSLNPYWSIGNLRTLIRRDDIIGNLDVAYELTPWLKANAKISSNLSFVSTQNNSGALIYSDFAVLKRGFVSVPSSTFSDQSNSSRINFDYYMNGERPAGKYFNVKYLAGGMIRQNRFKQVSVGGQGLVVNNLFNPNIRSGEPTLGVNQIINSTSYSIYGTFGLGYKNWAFVEVTGRNDWDSRLLLTNRSFFYPAVNGSFILSDAVPSIKNNILTYAKLRGSYSKSANVNLGAYSTLPAYGNTAGFPYGVNAGIGSTSVIPDRDLRPETVLTTELGFELGFLKNNRVSFEATYFNQDCKDQILAITQSAATGYQTGLANAARFKNYGVELDLGLSPLINVGKGRFDLKVNATYNNNEVKETFRDLPVVVGGSNGFIQNSVSSPVISNVAIVGRPAFAYQLTDYLRDPQGRVIVDGITGMPTQASVLPIMGRSLPLWVVGVTPSFTLGDISISMTWDYKTGHNFYSGLGSDMDFSGISARSAQYNRQNFIFPNSVIAELDGSGNPTGKYLPNTNVLTQDGNYNFWTNAKANNGIATNYYASAAAIRLRELNISYNIPTKIINYSKIFKRLTFAVVGKNLFLFVPKSNQWGDPEFNYSSTNNTFGISSSFQSPSARLLGLSLTAQF